VRSQLPQRFPAQVADSILRGLLDAARTLEAMPAA
jgi:hypothetical protein